MTAAAFSAVLLSLICVFGCQGCFNKLTSVRKLGGLKATHIFFSPNCKVQRSEICFTGQYQRACSFQRLYGKRLLASSSFWRCVACVLGFWSLPPSKLSASVITLPSPCVVKSPLLSASRDICDGI